MSKLFSYHPCLYYNVFYKSFQVILLLLVAKTEKFNLSWKTARFFIEMFVFNVTACTSTPNIAIVWYLFNVDRILQWVVTAYKELLTTFTTKKKMEIYILSGCNEFQFSFVFVKHSLDSLWESLWCMVFIYGHGSIKHVNSLIIDNSRWL